MEFAHRSVLLHECIDALAIKPDGIYLDGTLGGAGHSLEIGRRLTAGGRLIALARDRPPSEAAQRRRADAMTCERNSMFLCSFSRRKSKKR